MTYQVLISIACLYGIYNLFQITEKIHFYILLTLILSVTITWFNLNTFGFVLYNFSLIIYFIVVLIQNKPFKIQILFTIIPLIVANIFSLFNWPLQQVINLTLILSIILYLRLIFNPKLRTVFKNQLGILTILAFDELVKILTSIQF
jgi:hypothetical protein